MSVQYRLSWETVEPVYADVFCASEKLWENLTPEQWDALPWQGPTRRVGAGSELHDQRRTLELWAEFHHQPIRNVTFERREIPDDYGWEPALALGDQGAPS